MKKLILTIVAVFFFISPHVWAGCGTATGNVDRLTITLPRADFAGSQYAISLEAYHNPLDDLNLYFRLGSISPASSTANPCALVADQEDNWDIDVHCVEYAGNSFTLSLEYRGVGRDGLYWQLVSASETNTSENRKPVAESISLSVDSTLPYIQQQLAGSDPDNDSIVYELASPVNGTGYSAAYVNPDSGMLYLTHEPGNHSFSIEYRVTDGLLFSDPAEVIVQVTYLSQEDKETGKNDVIPEEYARFKASSYYSDLLGAVNAAPSRPPSIDLSINFPSPGDQGRQSSCVGWAAAYALKSYQEKIEIGWSLNTPSHLFSPAFLYNQINDGRDQGSYIHEALDLIVNKGAATLDTMPYSDNDFLTQPPSAAFNEAAQYKALSWSRVNDTSQVKAALANKKPVIGGITVFQQLMDLKGEDSVYNTASGENLGGHAVTLVGYDDNRYGGAFKVINSWSRNWGDNGFFWMPYDFAARGILSEAYVLEDAENQVTPEPEDPTTPEPDDNTLANLTVESWDATYDPKPRGKGSLRYSVRNTGTGPALAGAEVNLMLSANREITGNDYYVIYEPIPFDLLPGESAYREQANEISFQFPDQLEPGTYYMALWVDDLDVVPESNENDNISRGDSAISITSSLPDLSVTTWYAQWDNYGNGTLTYEVANNGAATTSSKDWDINLVLDPDQITGNGNEIILFYESAGYPLNPGGYIYRTEGFPAYFNLYQDAFGASVPAGVYYLALWVDDLDHVSESNELNNGSYSWNTVTVYGYGSVSKDEALSSNGAVAKNRQRFPQKAYNGRKMPSRNLVMKKIEISKTKSARDRLFLDQDNNNPKKGEQSSSLATKTISASSALIFPSQEKRSMPRENQ